jgi:hypothetical protein
MTKPAFLYTPHIWADGALLGAPQDLERKSSAETPSSGYHWNDPSTVYMQPNLHWGLLCGLQTGNFSRKCILAFTSDQFKFASALCSIVSRE